MFGCAVLNIFWVWAYGGIKQAILRCPHWLWQLRMGIFLHFLGRYTPVACKILIILALTPWEDELKPSPSLTLSVMFQMLSFELSTHVEMEVKKKAHSAKHLRNNHFNALSVIQVLHVDDICTQVSIIRNATGHLGWNS